MCVEVNLGAAAGIGIDKGGEMPYIFRYREMR